MSSDGYPLIAREGLWLIALTLAGALLIAHQYGLDNGLIAAVLPLLLILKFRDPGRRVPPVPLGIVSPVDGRVIDLQPVSDSPLGEAALRLTLRIDTFAAYSVRAPVEGKVLEPPKSMPGCGLRRGLWLRTDECDELIMAIKGPRLGRPAPRARVGERLGQGHRCGWLRLGTRAVLDLPANAKLHVKPGDRVRSGSSVLAEFGRDGKT